jgi:hypothetical protein
LISRLTQREQQRAPEEPEEGQRVRYGERAQLGELP